MRDFDIHEKYMRHAIDLAEGGVGRTDPNPLVGAVVVKDEHIVAEGFHEHIGGFHAERNALLSCSDADAECADLYVTLEPCCHTGKTPPCTDIIIEKNISRVFIGAMDPNPLVAGKGAEILRQHGIEVVTGILEEECLRQNEVFFWYITHHTPFVISKFAETLDGKIATVSGDSKWITGEAARKRVHEDRNRYPAIMVGIGTVLADDPELSCRLDKGGRDPVRVVCDSKLSIPLSSKLVKTAGSVPLIIACSETAAASLNVREKAASLKAAGAEVLFLPEKNGRPDPAALLTELGKKELDAVLVEGGGELHYSMLSEGLVNKVMAYVAPKIVGGRTAKTPVEGEGIARLSDAVRLSFVSSEKLGDDILLTYDVIG